MKDIYKEIHIAYLNHMRDNESKVINLLVALVTAFGGFFVVKVYYENLLLYATIGTTLLLFWGILYALSMSYVHRYLQILMWCYEEKLRLARFSDWNPKEKFSVWGCKKIFLCEIAPSTYKTHVIIFSLGILFFWLTFLRIKVQINIFSLIPWGLLISSLIWILIMILNFHYISKIKKLLK